MALRIRNWKSFQHYHYRKPPWIKLYREILEDKQWHELSGDTAKGLIMLWLIASEADGYLPDSATLAFRLRIPENRAIALLSDCSHWIEGFASNVLAECYQDATPEKSRVRVELEKTLPQNLSAAYPAAGELGSPAFHEFWQAYPRKLDKQETLRSWVKGLCDGHLIEILAGLEKWKATEQWTDPEKIPYPSTWLNKRRWRDAPEGGKAESKNERARRKTQEAIARVRENLGVGG